MVFKCKDGEVKLCDSKVLATLSDFFNDKVSGHENFNEPLIFNYGDYDFNIIEAFLDYCYGDETKIDQLDLVGRLQMLQFLYFEGKSEYSGRSSN